jgi:hypothetical protein
MQDYNKIDQQMHRLAQLIAKTNRNYVTKKADDSHTNLYLDSLGNRLMGQWFGDSQKEILLCFNLNNGCLEWINKQQQVLESMSIAGKSMDELLLFLKDFAKSKGLDASAYDKPMHYEIPDYKLSNVLQSSFDPDAFKGWTAVRALANEACNLLSGYLQQNDQPRIWPHHFDTGIYLQVSNHLGIGFGLAMKDEMVGDAYFYMAAYAKDLEIDYCSAEPLDDGYWITKGGWKGAVLPLASHAEEKNIKKLNEFLLQTTNWFLGRASMNHMT